MYGLTKTNNKNNFDFKNQNTHTHDVYDLK